jgi:hypothetical protein
MTSHRKTPSTQASKAEAPAGEPQTAYLCESTPQWASKLALRATASEGVGLPRLRDVLHTSAGSRRGERVDSLIEGDCPTCGHVMSRAVIGTDFADDVLSWDWFVHRLHSGRDRPGAVELVLWCNCSIDHPGAPERGEGCGRYGWVRLVPGAGVVRAWQAGPDDLRWEQRAERLADRALEDVRNAAQKWAATIASVTGVFGIVAVIKGPADLEAVSGFGEFVAKALVGAAVSLALVSIMMAALAAEGTPKLRRFSAREMRSQVRSQAKLAKLQLKLSRTAAVVAVLSMLTALLLTWYS